MIDLILGNNMDIMPEYDDNHFDLAIVDPPYGAVELIGNRPSAIKHYKEKGKSWNKEIPKDIYFNELIRVSKNQIIWGGNYFPCLWVKGCKAFIFWYKKNPALGFADGELAWTSFTNTAKCYEYQYFGIIEGHTKAEEKIHPTQKPIKLYEWILKNYANEGDKILDTHLGSGSIAVACYNYGYDLTGIEIDEEYYNAAQNRIDLLTKQYSLFK